MQSENSDESERLKKPEEEKGGETDLRFLLFISVC
jgi:hypothetical protein